MAHVAVRPPTLRAAALLPAGAFAVHQLRFTLAFGSRAGDELSRQGHGYLTLAAPALVVLLLVAGGRFLAGLAGGRCGSRRARTERLWPAASAALLGAFCLQETLEGFLASGHPAGLAGVFDANGWLAFPLSIVVGLGIALALRGAASASELVGRTSGITAPRPAGLFTAPIAPPPPRLDPPARLASARGPPPASVSA